MITFSHERVVQLMVPGCANIGTITAALIPHILLGPLQYRLVLLSIPGKLQSNLVISVAVNLLTA